MSLDLPYKEKEINGTTYRSYTLNLDDWADLTESLASLLGDPMGAILRGDTTGPQDLGRSDIQFLIGGIVSKISKSRILDLTRHMGKSLRQNGQLLNAEQQKIYWPAHMKDLAGVVTLFLEAQYSDFFEGFGASLSGLAMPQEEKG